MRELDDLYGQRERTIEGPLFDGDPFANSTAQPTTDELLIASLIWKHRGRQNPIAIARLRELTGFTERQIKGIVEQLVVTHKIQIGGRRQEPVGYFVVEDADDQAVAVEPYEAQIISMLRRLRVLASPRRLREFLGQLGLTGEE
ncbi:MAG: hypothetical protein ACE15B_19380 [Bryobacteraceae bacterium]